MTGKESNEGFSIDENDNKTDEAFHDDLWNSIPVEVRRRQKLATVREIMHKYGLTEDVAMSLYYGNDED